MTRCFIVRGKNIAGQDLGNCTKDIALPPFANEAKDGAP